jgi:hypothetical protein
MSAGWALTGRRKAVGSIDDSVGKMVAQQLANMARPKGGLNVFGQQN